MLETPDITRAQLLVVAKDSIAVAVAFGAPLTQTQQLALLALAGSTSILLVAADALIRRARAQHVAGPAVDHATATALAAAAPATPDPVKAATERAAAEAEAEQAAQTANDGGIDPATR